MRATERRSVHNLELLTVGCLLFPGELNSSRLQLSASPWLQRAELLCLVSVGSVAVPARAWSETIGLRAEGNKTG